MDALSGVTTGAAPPASERPGRHITGLHEAHALPGIVITPVAPAAAHVVRTIQSATNTYWNQLPLSAALDNIDRTSSSLLVVAPADPSEISSTVRALRLFWGRQLVPLIL